MTAFWLSFFPIFVSVNAIGTLPIFMGFTYGLETKKVHRIIFDSVLTATVVALIFLVLGRLILRLLGITVADFMIAGGILLFVISIEDLTAPGVRGQQFDPESMGSVPLGVPLLVGPAVLTSIVVLAPQQGMIATIAATIVNILLAGLMFWFSTPILRLLGKSGARTLAKIADLILAAFAVMMVRRGIMLLISGATDIL